MNAPTTKRSVRSLMALSAVLLTVQHIDAASCNGLITQAHAMPDAPVVQLLPETGDGGQPVLVRHGVEYRSDGGQVLVAARTGRCPYQDATAALCSGSSSTLHARPSAGVTLTAWGAEYHGQLRLTYRRASDVAARRRATAHELDAGNGTARFVGICADAADPIAELELHGDALALTNVRHVLAPAQPVATPPATATTQIRAAAVIQNVEAAIAQVNAATRQRIEASAAIGRFRGLLRLPPDASTFDVAQALERRPDLAGEFSRVVTAELAAATADARANVAALVRSRDAELNQLGFAASNTHPIDAAIARADPTARFSGQSKTFAAADQSSPAFRARPILFSSLEVRDVYADPQYNVVRHACEGALLCTWPIPYDVVPRQVYVTWRSPTLSVSELGRIVVEDGYELRLKLNGVPLTIGAQIGYSQPQPNGQGAWAANFATVSCPANNACLTTAILALNAMQNLTYPLSIELTVHKIVPLASPQIVAIDLYGNPIVVQHARQLFAQETQIVNANPASHLSFFELLIFDTYSHDRCTDCHGFGDAEGLRQHHYPFMNVSNTQDFVTQTGLVELPSLYVPGAHVMACSFSCHSLDSHDNHGNAFTEVAWKVPHFDLDVDWRNMNASQACNRTKQNLPTEALRHEHFHGDARLFWAVEDPQLLYETLPSAPPHSFSNFLFRMDVWNDNGAPCP